MCVVTVKDSHAVCAHDNDYFITLYCRYVPGGCFAVTREQIFKRSKAFYYEMLVS
jgi:hypothetical protein